MADPTADEPGKQPPSDAPPTDGATPASPPQETDTLFRLQMAASDFILGNVKYVGAAVGVLLLATLVYGLTASWLSSREAEEFAAIAAVDHKMPKVDPLAQFGLAAMDDKTDAARMANVEEGARRYLAAGEESHGAAAVYAYLKAAETFARVDKKNERTAALEKASQVGAKDLAGYTADAALAGAWIDAGRVDDALGLYRDMAGRLQGFYAERSLILLAEAQVAAGKSTEARLVIDEFKLRFPTSPRTGDLAAIEQRIASGG